MFNRKKYQKEWHQRNKESENRKARENYEKNKTNPNYQNKYQNRSYYLKNYQRERKKIDLKFRLDNNIGTIIWLAIKSKKAGRKWQELVGYTLQD